MEFAPKFLVQIMLKLDLLDVLSTSTTVSGVFTVRLSKDFDVCKRVFVQALQDALTGLKHPQTSFNFLYVH